MHTGRTGSLPPLHQRTVRKFRTCAAFLLQITSYSGEARTLLFPRDVIAAQNRRRVLFLRFLDKIYRMADNVIQQIRQILNKGGWLMRQCMDSDNLHRRLKKIIGQVQAIDRMIDEDIPCEDILSQINAAKSALHKVGQIVLEGHINHCVKDGIEHGDVEQTIASFTKAVERFANMK